MGLVGLDADRLILLADFDRILSRSTPQWQHTQGPWKIASLIKTRETNSTFNTLLRYELNEKKFSNSELGLTPHVKRLLQPHVVGRKVRINPLRIFEAPGLVDDFYLNLVNWIPLGNIIAVGLGTSVIFIQNPLERHSKSFRFSQTIEGITSVSHSPLPSSLLAAGLIGGSLILWDVATGSSALSLFKLHAGRIGIIAWRDPNFFTVGGRDKRIRNIDLRAPSSTTTLTFSHAQEVCGLAWDPVSCNLLASGGNDNRLLIWDIRKANSAVPLFEFTDHAAAVKAVAWSPLLSNVLVSGGGTLDRRLVLRDLSQNPTIISAIDTGSQICNVQWSSRSSNNLELVTSHGYTQNQLVLWRVSPQFAVEQQNLQEDWKSSSWIEDLPSGARLTPLAHFKQERERIVYMAPEPMGEHIVTGTGEGQLKVWQVFVKAPK